MTIGASASATVGMRNALQTYNRAVEKISEPNTVAGVEDVTDLKASEQQFKVNAKAAAVANQTSEHLIDIIA